MHTRHNSLLARFSGGLSVTALALAFSFGGAYAVRAEDPEVSPSSLQEMVAPIMQAVAGLEQRLTGLEATVEAWADSLTTRRIVVQQLCIADESGAQTCVTKGQLDAFLLSVAHADIAEPAVSETQASIPAPAEPAANADPLPTEPSVVEAEPLPAEPAATPAAPIPSGAAAIEVEPLPSEEAAIEAEPLPSEAAAIPAELLPTEPAAVSTDPLPTEAAALTADPLPIEVTAGLDEHLQAPDADEHTGSIATAPEGAALVSVPAVDVSIAVPAASCD